jgi:hypothetical protein
VAEQDKTYTTADGVVHAYEESQLPGLSEGPATEGATPTDKRRAERNTAFANDVLSAAMTLKVGEKLDAEDRREWPARR